MWSVPRAANCRAWRSSFIPIPFFSARSVQRWKRWMSSAKKTRVVDMAAEDGELRVFIVAGEVSGDCIGSCLMASLKRISPFPVSFSGVGGHLMQNEGLKPLFRMEDIAVMGAWELLPHINVIRKKINETTTSAVNFRPHVVVTIDAKGFSFRFLKRLREKYRQQETNSPIHMHYVAPSFWAWKGGESRLKGLSQFVDHVLCILPFEEEVCRNNGLNATFVGHPICDYAFGEGKDIALVKPNEKRNEEAFKEKHGLSLETELITLLPGSRLQEVTRILPIFIKTLELLKGSFPNVSAIVPVASNADVESYIYKAVQNGLLSAILVPGASFVDKHDAFNASRAALCASGSSVLELLLARLPCVVAYRAHFITECIVKLRAQSQFISLPNILLGSSVIPEVLFDACTPEYLAGVLKSVLCDTNIRQKQTAAADEVFELLLPPETSFDNVVTQNSSTVAKSPSSIAASLILYSVNRTQWS